MTAPLVEKLIREAKRIEEDTEHSAKAHYNAADAWSKRHLWLGLPAVLSAAIASGLAFSNHNLLAGSLALLSTALATVMTFLNPSERAEQHKAAAGAYHELRNKARLFREIEVPDTQQDSALKKRLLSLDNSRNKLNRTNPGIPRRAYEEAKADIDEGRTQYLADKEPQ